MAVWYTMDVGGSEASGILFFLYRRLYLGDAEVQLVLFLTGGCRGVGDYVAGGDSCRCCTVSIVVVGDNCTKELCDIGVL